MTSTLEMPALRNARFANVAALSAPGPRRPRNEDAFLTGDHMLAVADGMGGHEGGHVASQRAIRSLAAFGAARGAHGLRTAIERANTDVLAAGAERPSARMGTTLSICRLEGGELGVAHVGDSRVYLMSHGHLSQLTRDHSFAQQLVDVGALTPEEARRHPGRKMITQALGRPDPEIAITGRAVSDGDIVVACSDGLSDALEEDEIAAVLRSSDDLELAAETLLHRASTADRAGDDVTVVLGRVEQAA